MNVRWGRGWSYVMKYVNLSHNKNKELKTWQGVWNPSRLMRAACASACRLGCACHHWKETHVPIGCPTACHSIMRRVTCIKGCLSLLMKKQPQWLIFRYLMWRDSREDFLMMHFGAVERSFGFLRNSWSIPFHLHSTASWQTGSDPQGSWWKEENSVASKVW